MKLTKKEQKLLNKIEAEYRQKFNNTFVELMLKYIPFDENTPLTKVPCKQKLLKDIDAIINPTNNLIISGMLSKFINEQYEVINERTV